MPSAWVHAAIDLIAYRRPLIIEDQEIWVDPIFLMGTSKNEVGGFENFRCVKGWAGNRI